MKNKLCKALVASALIAFGTGLASCGGNSGGNNSPSDPTPAVLEPALSTDSIVLTQGTNDTVSLNNVDKELEFSWVSSDPDIARVTFRKNMAMISGDNPGEAVVTATVTYADGSSVSKSLQVVVNELVHVEVPLTDPHPDGFVEYVNDLHLALDYKEKDFFVDGVGEFDLWMAIDGDTAHFTPKVTKTSRETVKARFYGIDTPESTGNIQPYGKQASNFTKDKLMNAKEHGTIVLAGVSSEYGKPTTDANGRYLCCVWIHETKKNASFDELVNLNLWIIQEGYSNPGSTDKMPDYSQTFVNAFNQAVQCELKMHSGKEDPLFPKEAYRTSIPDIMKQVNSYLNGETDLDPFAVGINYIFKGTVSGFSNNTLFLQAYDFIEDRYYGINCFCGMSAINEMYKIPGTLLEVTGTAQNSENFGFQITGLAGNFPALPEFADDDDVKILLKAEENTNDDTKLVKFPMTAKELNDAVTKKSTRFEYLNNCVCLTDNLVVNYFKPNADENKFTVGFEGVEFDVYLGGSYAGDPDNPNTVWNKESQWKGKTMSIKVGLLTYHTLQSTGEIRFQLVIPPELKNNLVWVK